MNLKDIREMMGLSVSQTADELNLPRQDIVDGEENGGTYLFARFISVFPVNPDVLTNPQAEPFLSSYDRSAPGSRMKRWREENGISLQEMAQAIGETEASLSAFESGNEQVSRSRGEQIEKATGMNRKWLMYGDGREKGTPKIRRVRKTDPAPGKKDASVRNTAPNRDGGARIREARTAAGLTREKLAALAGLSVSRIVQMESGYVKDEQAERMVRLISAPAGNEEVQKAAGRQIREARKAAGLTIREAAELAGLKHTSLAHMESGYVTEKRAAELEAFFMDAASKHAFSGKEAGIQIREERKAAGLSQKELATILRMTPGAVSAIELGDVTEEKAAEILRKINGERRRPQGAVRRVKRTDQVLLGSNLRDAREAAGLSQKEVAVLIGTSQGKISLMERGKVDPATAREILQRIEEETKKRGR